MSAFQSHYNDDPVVAEAVPVHNYNSNYNSNSGSDKASPLQTDAAIDTQAALEFLQQHQFPRGLRDTFVASLSKLPMRYFIIDDSGSMSTNDGHMLVHCSGGTKKLVQCSRWLELTQSMKFHIEFACAARAPSEFRLLNGAHPMLLGNNNSNNNSNNNNNNNSSHNNINSNNNNSSSSSGSGSSSIENNSDSVSHCSGIVDIGSDKRISRSSSSSEMDELQRRNTLLSALNDSPNGSTPLCRHIREVVNSLRQQEQSLRAAGKKAVLVIATDGESSDGNVTEAMRPLKQLPVWVVVRLCTDEQRVVQYWNSIDQQLELNIDVIDDLCGEAREIRAVNPWLTYGQQLHWLREFGIVRREFDLIDEKQLSAEQLRNFCCMLFGGELEEYPHPELDWAAFVECIAAHNSSLNSSCNDSNNNSSSSSIIETKPWDLILDSPRDWIDIRALQSAYRPSFCTIS